MWKNPHSLQATDREESEEELSGSKMSKIGRSKDIMMKCEILSLLGRILEALNSRVKPSITINI